MTDHITAEDVIAAARAFLKSGSPYSWDSAQSEAAQTALDNLRSAIDRYDAQPNPRWLKPEEVRDEGDYWTLTPDGDTWCRGGPVYVTDERIVFEWYKPIDLYPDRRFYGPLPEPPPPEVTP